MADELNRTAPAAQLVADLPPLPAPWGTMYSDALQEKDGYTEDQMRGFAIDAIASRDAHIASLELELAERKQASIDTPEFRELADSYADAEHGIAMGFGEAIKDRDERLAKLIAHIDGRPAGTAPSIEAQRQAWNAAVATVRAGFVESSAADFVKTLLIQTLDSLNTYAQSTFDTANQPKGEGA
jgi:hypothetical protein